MPRRTFNLTYEVRVKIGQRLETLWEESGLERGAVADKAGFGTRHFQRALKGEKDVAENALDCFAKALGTTLEKLYSEVIDEAPPQQEEDEESFYKKIKTRIAELASIKKRSMKFLVLVVALALLFFIGVYFLPVQFGKTSNVETKQNPSNQNREQLLTAGTSDERQKVVDALRANFLFELESYKNPEGFEETQLNNYWVQDGAAFVQVKKAVKRLRDNELHYGPESTYEDLVFISVQISPSGKYAEVRTRESLYQPLYNSQGERLETRHPLLVGSYIYTLRKLNGKWLLQTTGAPYRE